MERTAEIQGHEERLQEDHEDLIELRKQVDKIQTLRVQFDQQKEEINSLTHTIDELKSQNEDLTCKLEKGSKENDDCLVTNSQERYFGPVLSEDPEQQPHNRTIGYSPRGKNASQNRVKRNKLLQGDCEVKSARNKTINELQRLHQPQPKSNGFYQFRGMSYRSGEIRHNTYQDHQRQPSPQFNKYIRNIKGQLRFQSHQSTTKHNLVQNLVSDLKFQLQEKDSMMREKVGIIGRLQDELMCYQNENRRLSQTQDYLHNKSEFLARENSCLQAELLKQRQLEYEKNQCYQGSLVRKWADEEEDEFRKMDLIYHRFTGIIENRQSRS